MVAHGVIGHLIVDPLSYFSFLPVLHDWNNNSHGMCYPGKGMVHLKYSLLLIKKISQCSGISRFSHYLKVFYLMSDTI